MNKGSARQALEDQHGLRKAEAEARARLTYGVSGQEVVSLAAAVIRECHPRGGRLVDIGCGTGTLWHQVSDHVAAYVGVDVCRYEGFPPGAEFFQVDLDSEGVPLTDGSADVLTALGVVECLENPYALMREINRLTRPGALILLSTPNQLSWLSKLTLLLKNHFNAFQGGAGTPMRTALLEGNLLRMAQECGFLDIQVKYPDHGRIPLTAWHWPCRLGFRGRLFSDTLLLMAKRDKR
jgi:2-polyprenyl-3-methyl-5-hydroxy-6-metoxy-1,4-benzoquinol methylase